MIILDTNVVSELMRPSPAESIVEWVSGQDISNLYLSTITEAELRYGVEIMHTGRRSVGMGCGLRVQRYASGHRSGDAADSKAYAGGVEEVEYSRLSKVLSSPDFLSARMTP